jgi:hypothetical protein
MKNISLDLTEKELVRLINYTKSQPTAHFAPTALKDHQALEQKLYTAFNKMHDGKILKK